MEFDIAINPGETARLQTPAPRTSHDPTPGGGFEIDGDRPLTRRVLPDLLRLAAPIIAARVGIQVMGLTDAVVVGRNSAQQLGFHALGWAPTMVVLVSGIGLLNGVQVLAARRMGEGRPEQAGAVLRRGLVYAFWLGVGATALLALGGPAFLRVSGIAPSLAEGAGRALRIFALSLTPYLLACVCSFWLEALERPGAGVWAMWIANAVNLALNLLFVPGSFGLPALGAVGAGLATLGARGALLLMLAVYIARMPDARALGVFARPARDRAAEVEQRRIGYAGGLSYFAEVGAFSGMNIVAGWLGALQVAAWAIVLNVAAVVFMVPLGLSAAAAVLVGRAYGARDGRGVVRAGVTAFAVSTGLGVAFAALLWPTAAAVAGAYASDPGLRALTAAALGVAALFLIPDGLQVVASASLRARGDVWLPTCTHIASYAGVMAPLGWWLSGPMGMGVVGCVWAVVIASWLSAGLLLARFAWLARLGPG